MPILFGHEPEILPMKWHQEKEFPKAVYDETGRCVAHADTPELAAQIIKDHNETLKVTLTEEQKQAIWDEWAERENIPMSDR